MNLTAEQLAVLSADGRIVVVLAGPGSGKTTTLIAKIDQLTPEQLAATVVITFTTAAAGEIRKRLAKTGKKPMFAGTVHAYCLSLLCREGRKIGLSGSLSVISQDASEELMSECISQLSYRGDPASVREETERNPKLIPNAEPLASKGAYDVAMLYHTKLLQGGLLDYAAILSYGAHLIKNGAKWRPSYLIVDEAQDSCAEEWAVYAALNCQRYLFCGDLDQSVHEWRGATPKKLLSFCQPDSKVKADVRTITVNHRSGPEICIPATRLISRNIERVKKDIVSAFPTGGQITVGRPVNRAAELQALVAWAATAGEREFAVLCRSNAECAQVRDALATAKIKIQGRASKPEGLVTAMAFLASAAAPANNELAYIYLKRKIGKKAADALKAETLTSMLPLVVVALKHYPHGLYDIQGQSINFAVHDADLVRCLVKEVYQFGDSVNEYIAKVHEGCPDDCTVGDLLMSLDGEIDESKSEGIWVSTMHRSKGLEWDEVFLPGWVAGKFPKRTFAEEERRLAFVAVTRAKSRVIISAPKMAVFRFNDDEQPASPSQFITELLG